MSGGWLHSASHGKRPLRRENVHQRRNVGTEASPDIRADLLLTDPEGAAEKKWQPRPTAPPQNSRHGSPLAKGPWKATDWIPECESHHPRKRASHPLLSNGNEVDRPEQATESSSGTARAQRRRRRTWHSTDEFPQRCGSSPEPSLSWEARSKGASTSTEGRKLNYRPTHARSRSRMSPVGCSRRYLYGRSPRRSGRSPIPGKPQSVEQAAPHRVRFVHAK